MNRPYIFGMWWDALGNTEAHNGYNPKDEENHAQFRIGRFHVYWGIDEES